MKRLLVWSVTIALAVIGLPASAAVDTTGVCPRTALLDLFPDVEALPDGGRAALCLYHFGISGGSGNFLDGDAETLFQPYEATQRWQMSLFLSRLLTVLDVGAEAPDSSGFDDLEGLSPEALVAINRLSSLGITQGTSDTTFSPYQSVERWQMALFLDRVLTAAGVEPRAGEASFMDLGGLSDAAISAISSLSLLGIADGTTESTFSPYESVERWQMAFFLTRTMAVTDVNYVQPTSFRTTVAGQTFEPGASEVTLGFGETITVAVQLQSNDGSDAALALVPVQFQVYQGTVFVLEEVRLTDILGFVSLSYEAPQDPQASDGDEVNQIIDVYSDVSRDFRLRPNEVAAIGVTVQD